MVCKQLVVGSSFVHNAHKLYNLIIIFQGQGPKTSSTLKASTTGQRVKACLAGGWRRQEKVEALKGQSLKGRFKASGLRLEGGLEGGFEGGL